METVKPDLCKILRMNNIPGKSERFRIVFPLVLDVISRSHRYSYRGSFWFTFFFFQAQTSTMGKLYIWFRNKMTLCKKKNEKKMIESFASLGGQFLIM